MNKIINLYKRTGAPRQLIMFPFGGGNAFSYIELAHIMHSHDIEIVFVNPPGHLFCERKPLESVSDMVRLYLDELKSELKNELVLFGHSLGGIVAYEVCKVLEKERNVRQLVISAVNPLHCILDDVNIHSDMDNEEIVAASNDLGGIRGALLEDKEFLNNFASALRADIKALETYQPEKNPEKLKTPTTILCGTDDVMEIPKMREWSRYLNVKQFIEFSGNHFYLFDDDNKKRICRLLKDSLRPPLI